MNSLVWPRLSPYSCFVFSVKDTAVKKRSRRVRDLCNNRYQFLLLDNILCGRSFGAVDNIEGHPRAFLQGFEALGLNCGMMHEYILAAILLNKTKTF